jgi:hypothetical protein
MALPVAFVALAGLGAASSASADDEHIVIRGCVTDAKAPSIVAPSTFVWSRSDIMLATAEARSTAVPLRDRIFYWLDDDDDLGKYRGQKVEIQGELQDIEKGKVDGEKITFEVSIEPGTIAYAGTVKGDEMTFEVTGTRGDKMTLVAKRQK